MSVVVRAAKDFTAYHGPTCQLLTLAAGQEIEGDVAVYLATTCGSAVEVVDDPDGAIAAALAAVTGPAVTETSVEVDADATTDETAVDDAADDDSSAGDDEPEPEQASDPDPLVGAQDPAGDSADDPAGPFDPSQHTVAEVLAYAKAHPEAAGDLLAAERTGRARTTILSELA